MAKKKRVTLPKNFKELIQTDDLEMMKAVYEQCELYASYDGRYGLNTALHYGGVPDELVVWLVEQGLDVNIENYYGRTPLYEQATLGRNTVKLLFELGGDIEKSDQYGNSPLHTAAKFFHTDTVLFLVEKGANIHAQNHMGKTPLAIALSVCCNANICKMAEIASILLQAGSYITSDMTEDIKRIGEEFEFHRADFNRSYIVQTIKGLEKLYKLFGVEPIAERKIHDQVSPIIVEDGEWKKQYEALWNLLVPSTGPAKTVQGEVIRISGRVQDELYRNGGVNWDKDYRKMLNALLRYFTLGVSLPEGEMEEAKKLTSSISAKCDDDFITERLCELSVLWILSNPNPIPLEKTNYTR